MNRYFLPAESWEESTLTLTGDEAKHCARVMRARVGDHIEIFDGKGKSAPCVINAISRSAIQCQIIESHTQTPPSHPITLCQAIPKGGNMELIVQKSVELGVSTIQPLITTHTVARPESIEKKQAKWQRIALEACKQCGQNFLPEVKTPLLYSQWIEQLPNFSTAIIASLDAEAVSFKSIFAKTPDSGDIALLVGPEGDFSPQEYHLAYENGFQPVSFGNIIMRVETASIYGLSVLRHELALF